MQDIVRIRTSPGGPRGTWPRPGRPPCWTRSPWRCRDLFGLAAGEQRCNVYYIDIDIDLTRCDWGGLAQDVLDYLRGYEQGIPLLQTKANKEGVNCPRSGPLSSGRPRLALLLQRDTATRTQRRRTWACDHVTTILLGCGLLGRGNQINKYPGTPGCVLFDLPAQPPEGATLQRYR